MHGKVISPKYGSFLRWVFIITDMPLECDAVFEENLCDRCCIIQKGKLQGVYDLAELRAEGRSLEEIFMRIVGETTEGEDTKCEQH